MHKVHVFVPHHAGNIVQHSPHGGRKALRGNMVEIYQPRQRPTLTGAVLKATFETAVILLQVANVTLRTAQKLSSTEFRELAQ